MEKGTKLVSNQQKHQANYFLRALQSYFKYFVKNLTATLFKTKASDKMYLVDIKETFRVSVIYTLLCFNGL